MMPAPLSLRPRLEARQEARRLRLAEARLGDDFAISLGQAHSRLCYQTWPCRAYARLLSTAGADAGLLRSCLAQRGVLPPDALLFTAGDVFPGPLMTPRARGAS